MNAEIRAGGQQRQEEGGEDPQHQREQQHEHPQRDGAHAAAWLVSKLERLGPVGVEEGNEAWRMRGAAGRGGLGGLRKKSVIRRQRPWSYQRV